MKRHLYSTTLPLLLSLLMTPLAIAKGPQCLALYQSKKYEQSASCFEKWGQTMLLKPGQSKEQLDVIRGRAFSNAATAYRKAAKLTKKRARRSFFLHRGVRLLQLYLKHKYYEVPEQKKRAQLQMLKMQNQLGLATLSIAAGDKEAKITVTGYRFRHISKGVWNRKVRPGTYRIQVRYKTKSMSRSIEIFPNKPVIETFQPPKRAPKAVVRVVPVKPMPIQTNLKIISFVLLGAGGALAITGGILAGVGASADGEKQRLYAAALADRKNNTPIKPEATAEITAQHNTAAALIPTGWVFLSVGLVAAGAGAALFFLTRPRPLTKPKRAQRTPSAPPKTPAYVLGVY